MKVVQLHEKTPKQYSNPSPTPKIAHWGRVQKKSWNFPTLSETPPPPPKVGKYPIFFLWWGWDPKVPSHATYPWGGWGT